MGYVRAFDVRTGKRLWIFHTVPRPGEFGHDSWLEGSAANTGNTGVWAQMSVDEELDTVYMPVELPTGDYYGGHRPGNGLFGESIVALDLTTGSASGTTRLVHHGIWDWDIPCAPILVDIVVDGKPIKAIAQPTKQGWVYVLDRATGAAGVADRRAASAGGDVPREWYSPTQPFVTKPPAFERQGVSVDDLIDFTPELRAEAIKVASRYKLGPLFTPPVVSKWEGPLATLMLPQHDGRRELAGRIVRSRNRRCSTSSRTRLSARIGLVPGCRRDRDMNLHLAAARPIRMPQQPGAGPRPAAAALTVQGLPLVKPPYGRITALDLNKGELLWQIAHGDTPDNIRNHAALKGLTIPRTGRTGPDRRARRPRRW